MVSGEPEGPKTSWHLSYRWGKTPEKTTPRKLVPSGDRTLTRCVTGEHATACSTAVDIIIKLQSENLVITHTKTFFCFLRTTVSRYYMWKPSSEKHCLILVSRQKLPSEVAQCLTQWTIIRKIPGSYSGADHLTRVFFLAFLRLSGSPGDVSEEPVT